jgi:exopolysaccharide biosynthesis polyprenyl glycosylphosphotransferase
VASITRGLPGPPEAEESPLAGRMPVAMVSGETVTQATAPAVLGAVPSDHDGLVTSGTRPREVQKQGARLRRHLAGGDLVALAVVWLPLALISSGRAIWPQLAAAAAATALTILAIQRAGLYRARVCAVRSLETLRVVWASVLGALLFGGFEWLTGPSSVARPVVGAFAVAATMLVLRWRFGRWLKMKRSNGQFLRTVVLIGTNDEAVAVWKMISDEPELGYRVGAVVGEHRPNVPWEHIPTSAELGQLTVLAKKVGASGVIIVGNALGADATALAVNQAMSAGLHVQVWPGLAGLSSRRVRMSPMLGVPVFYLEPKGGAGWQPGLKRAMDIGLTLAISPLALPVLLVCAILIKLEDRGPVIYHHRVVGRYGAPITVLKLRTMVPNAAQLMTNVAALNERTGGPLFKASYDPRVTRIGRLLRATSIDELPQLWNVINGTMSLVGPRFALPAEAEHFDDELRRRQEMRPGMTGLWQSEARDNPSFSAYRRLDLFYIDNWSLSLDVAILANTLHGVCVRAARAVLPSVGRHTTPTAPAAEPVVQEP